MKKIQKQYERKVKVNQNHDIFTTFQRPSRQEPSLYSQQQSRQLHQIHSQHENIESLKSTLKSLMPVSMEMTKQYSRVAMHEVSQDRLEQSQGEEYMMRLDQLTKNLQQIASKCHFSSSTKSSIVKQQTINNNYLPKSKINQGNPQPSRYEATIAEHLPRQPNTSMQLPISRNHSFLDKDWKVQRSLSKSIRKQETSLKDIRNHHEDSYKNSQQSSSKRKRSSTKKDIIQGTLSKQSHSKNLVKLFESYDTLEMSKGRERSESYGRRYRTIFNEKVHRHKITSLLVTDQIYTASLDYTIKKGVEKDGGPRFETVQSYRGGVEHLASVGGTVLGCGRDNYIRSVDTDYFYKCHSTPLIFSQADKPSQINLTLASNELLLFDLEKRATLCCLQLDCPFTSLAKQNKQLYIGTSTALFSVDWRKKDYLVNAYKDTKRDVQHWLSDPLGRGIWTYGKGQISVLGNDFRRVANKIIPNDSSFETYHWGRNGLHILLSSPLKQTLFKYQEHKQAPQQTDSIYEQLSVSKLLVRDRQLYYGTKDGSVLIRQK